MRFQSLAVFLRHSHSTRMRQATLVAEDDRAGRNGWLNMTATALAIGGATWATAGATGAPAAVPGRVCYPHEDAPLRHAQGTSRMVTSSPRPVPAPRFLQSLRHVDGRHPRRSP